MTTRSHGTFGFETEPHQIFKLALALVVRLAELIQSISKAIVVANRHRSGRRETRIREATQNTTSLDEASLRRPVSRFSLALLDWRWSIVFEPCRGRKGDLECQS